MRNQTLGAIIGLIIGLVLSFVLFQSGVISSKNLLTSTSKPLQTANIVKNQNIEVPIPLDDPAVKLVGVAYNLQGVVEEVKEIPNQPQERELDLVGTGGKQTLNGLLIVTPTTQVTQTASGSSKIRATDLKPGDKITITYFYDLAQKRGTVGSIQLTK